MAADRSDADPSDVVLSSRERLELARFEEAAALADPRLDRSLRAGRPLRWHQQLARRSPQFMVAMAAVVWVIGAVLMLATFTRYLPIAALGCGLQALGMGTAIEQWVRVRRHA